MSAIAYKTNTSSATASPTAIMGNDPIHAMLDPASIPAPTSSSQSTIGKHLTPNQPDSTAASPVHIQANPHSQVLTTRVPQPTTTRVSARTTMQSHNVTRTQVQSQVRAASTTPHSVHRPIQTQAQTQIRVPITTSKATTVSMNAPTSHVHHAHARALGRSTTSAVRGGVTTRSVVGSEAVQTARRVTVAQSTRRSTVATAATARATPGVTKATSTARKQPAMLQRIYVSPNDLNTMNSSIVEITRIPLGVWQAQFPPTKPELLNLQVNVLNQNVFLQSQANINSEIQFRS